jgi:hypothetical protein
LISAPIPSFEKNDDVIRWKKISAPTIHPTKTKKKKKKKKTLFFSSSMGLVETVVGAAAANPLMTAVIGLLLPLMVYMLRPGRATDPPTFPLLAGIAMIALKRFADPVDAMLAAWRRWKVVTLTLPGVRVTLLAGPEQTAPFFRAPDSALDQTKVYAFTAYVRGRLA